MATAADLRAIEDDCPWLRADFQAGLASLTDSTAEQSRRFARDMVLLAELTAQVPRCPFDERGASPWTSFRREVAVARRMSDRGAAAEIRASVALTTCLPRSSSAPPANASKSPAINKPRPASTPTPTTSPSSPTPSSSPPPTSPSSNPSPPTTCAPGPPACPPTTPTGPGSTAAPNRPSD